MNLEVGLWTSLQSRHCLGKDLEIFLDDLWYLSSLQNVSSWVTLLMLNAN